MKCEKEKRSLVIPINSEELYRFGLPRTSATLNRRGICYQGLWYVSENYKEFLESHNIGEIVRICYDPEDVSRLFLLNGMNYIPFELSRHSKQYAGATESEYQMKRKAEYLTITKRKNKSSLESPPVDLNIDKKLKD